MLAEVISLFALIGIVMEPETSAEINVFPLSFEILLVECLIAVSKASYNFEVPKFSLYKVLNAV
ncbi:hypothetical protein D3C76_1330730 [compost metagenome]